MSCVDLSNRHITPPELASYELNANEKLMLTKTEVRTLESTELRLHEYTTIYSESYETPVMYFNISKQSKWAGCHDSHLMSWNLL